MRAAPRSGPGGAGAHGSAPLPRDPDSTYCDLPQPSQGDGDGVGGAEASMDVFQLQGLAASSAMVSGAGVRGGRGAGRRVRTTPPGSGLPACGGPCGVVRTFPSPNWHCVGSRDGPQGAGWVQARLDPGVHTAASVSGSLFPVAASFLGSPSLVVKGARPRQHRPPWGEDPSGLSSSRPACQRSEHGHVPIPEHPVPLVGQVPWNRVRMEWGDLGSSRHRDEP